MTKSNQWRHSEACEAEAIAALRRDPSTAPACTCGPTLTDASSPPPGWEFVVGSTTLCQPNPHLVSAMCRIFDAGPDPDDDELLYTPVTLERAHHLHADILAVLQPR